MKKIWKCPNCAQISTRRWNLKRHIDRRHKIGEPVRAYVSKKSTINFSTFTTIHDPYIIHQNDALRKMWRDDLFTITSNMKNSYDHNDKWFDILTRMYELGQRANQSNIGRLSSFAQRPRPLYHPFIGDDDFTRVVEIQDDPNAISDRVTGFKIGVCEKCLTTTSLIIESNMEVRKIKEVHKCDPKRLEDAKGLDPEQYYYELLTKVNNIPELLFEKCKDWAQKTTWELYLVARRFESKGEYEKVQIPENYKEIPWLKKLLVESVIKPDYNDLNNFLSLAINATTRLFTLKGKDASENLVYRIGVLTVPVPAD